MKVKLGILELKADEKVKEEVKENREVSLENKKQL